MTDIWMPGLGMTPINFVTAGNAVSDYSSDLMLGRNNKTGEWHVMVKDGPHDGQPFPVFNLGKELPPYDVIQRKLYESDVRRHGAKIVEQIRRRAEAEKRSHDAYMHDVAEDSAERIENAMRKGGMLPNLKIFVPSDLPSAGKE